MRTIELTHGQKALVDDSDYLELGKYSWHIQSSGYAARNLPRDEKGRKKQYLHTAIMGNRPGFEIDHINGNRLDNRRENLRFADRSSNIANMHVEGRGRSRYKGVYLNRGAGKWYAQIRKGYRLRHLGSYSSERDAAVAYNRAARECFGEYACLNQLPN